MAKILIVDDEPRIRELIRENLQYSGYTCEEAGDGSAALSLLTGGGYDLVILDLMMPFMDGMTCLREMRTRRINTPVIILTPAARSTTSWPASRAALTTMWSNPSPPGTGGPCQGCAQPHHAPHRGFRQHHDLRGAVHRHGQPHRQGVGRGSEPHAQGVRPAGLPGLQQGHRPQPREDPAEGVELRLLRRGPHRGHPRQDAARPSGKCRGYIATVWGIGYKFDPDAAR